jgi:hypothetical protein
VRLRSFMVIAQLARFFGGATGATIWRCAVEWGGSMRVKLHRGVSASRQSGARRVARLARMVELKSAALGRGVNLGPIVGGPLIEVVQ